MYLLITVVIVLVKDIKDCDAYDVSRLQNENLPINNFANSNQYCWYSNCWKRGGSCGGENGCCICKCKSGKTFYSDDLGCLSTEDIKKEILKTGKKCDFFTQTIPVEYIPIYELESDFQNVELSLRDGFKFDNDPAICSAGVIYLHDFHGHAKLYKRNECQNLLSARFKNKKLYLDWHSSNTSLNWDNMKGQLMSVQINCNFQAINSCFIFQVQGNYTQGKELEEPDEQQNCTENNLTTYPTLITESSSMKTSTSIIVASAVCVVLLLAFLGAFFLVYWCRRKPESVVMNDVHFRLINKEASARYASSEPTNETKRNKFKFFNALSATSSNSTKDELVEYASIDINQSNSSLKQYSTLERKKLSGIYQEDAKSITGTLSKRPLPDRPMEVNNPYYASNFLDNQVVYASSTEPVDKKYTNLLSQLQNNELQTIHSSTETLNKYDVLPTATLNKSGSMPPLSKCEEAPIYVNTLSSTSVDKKEPLYDSPNPTANSEVDLNPLYTLYSTIPDIKNAGEHFVN